MDTLSAQASSPAHVQSSAIDGIFAGIMGGFLFGILMQVTGMMSALAGMMNSQLPILGWFVHATISASFGAIYGLGAYKISRNWVVAGLVYGGVLWIFGSLIMMPLFMGTMIFTFSSMVWFALLGHLIFGFVTAWVFWLLSK